MWLVSHLGYLCKLRQSITAFSPVTHLGFWKIEADLECQQGEKEATLVEPFQTCSSLGLSIPPVILQ